MSQIDSTAVAKTQLTDGAYKSPLIQTWIVEQSKGRAQLAMCYCIAMQVDATIAKVVGYEAVHGRRPPFVRWLGERWREHKRRVDPAFDRLDDATQLRDGFVHIPDQHWVELEIIGRSFVHLANQLHGRCADALLAWGALSATQMSTLAGFESDEPQAVATPVEANVNTWRERIQPILDRVSDDKALPPDGSPDRNALEQAALSAANTLDGWLADTGCRPWSLLLAAWFRHLKEHERQATRLLPGFRPSLRMATQLAARIARLLNMSQHEVLAVDKPEELAGLIDEALFVAGDPADAQIKQRPSPSPIGDKSVDASNNDGHPAPPKQFIRCGQTFDLQPTPYRLLAALWDIPERRMTEAEAMDRVWGRDDAEDALRGAVSKLNTSLLEACVTVRRSNGYVVVEVNPMPEAKPVATAGQRKAG